MITARMLCFAAMGTAPAEVIVCDYDRRWNSRLSLAAGKKTIPAAVSCSFLAWVRSFLPFPLVWRYRRNSVSSRISFSGFFCPISPLKNPLVFADRVRGSPLFCIGSGTFWGGFYRSCSCLFTGLRSRCKIWSILPLTVCKRRYSSRFAR